MIRRLRVWAGVAAGVAALLATACSPPRDAVVVQDGMVIVENQTRREWRNIMITVNDHFRGGTPRLAAGSRLTAPLSQFQTAFGRKYDRARMSVFKVEVTATDSAGEPVKLEWGGRLGNQS